MKITAKDATRIATEYFQYVTGMYGLSITVEEIELTPEFEWEVVISYPESSSNPFESTQRSFKVLKVDAGNGEVKSMKIKSSIRGL